MLETWDLVSGYLYFHSSHADTPSLLDREGLFITVHSYFSCPSLLDMWKRRKRSRKVEKRNPHGMLPGFLLQPQGHEISLEELG